MLKFKISNKKTEDNYKKKVRIGIKEDREQTRLQRSLLQRCLSKRSDIAAGVQRRHKAIKQPFLVLILHEEPSIEAGGDLQSF